MKNLNESCRLRQRLPLKRFALSAAAALFALSAATAQERDYVQYVNTLQGTDSRFELSYGNTYPTTAMPYAMHTWSAQTGRTAKGGNTSTPWTRSAASSRPTSAARG